MKTEHERCFTFEWVRTLGPLMSKDSTLSHEAHYLKVILLTFLSGCIFPEPHSVV